MFFIYRNIVGTFLTIASWYKSSWQSEINTMVRIGDGYSNANYERYQPKDV